MSNGVHEPGQSRGGLGSRGVSMRGDSVFADLGDALRSETFMGSPWARLALSARPAHVAAGEWLFREGDAGDSLYVIASGRLEVVAETPEPTVLWRLGRGDAVGELGVLTGAPRPASVLAKRDSDLLRVSRDDFLAVLREDSDFAVEVTRIMGLQLERVRATSFAPDPLPSTIAIVPLDPGLDARPFCERLVAAFPSGRSALLEQPDREDDASSSSSALARLLDRSERDHDRVVLVGSDATLADAWTRFCLRAGDRVLGLTRAAGSAPEFPPEARLKGLDLVVLERPEPRQLSAWVDALDARATHLIAAAEHDATAGLARSLTGESVGLVLSGGGARAFAHIGVLDELVAAGIVIDRVAGSSMGSYIGALFALGLSPDEIAARCHEEFVVGNPMNDYTIPAVALTRGEKARHMLARSFGTARIEALPRRFFCLSCDLIESRSVVHRRGSLMWAVAGSMCLPTVFPPAVTPDGLLVDGGVLNNLPVEEMAALGEGPVIASDVSGRIPPPVPRRPLGPGSRRGRLLGRARGLIVGTDIPLPGIRDTLIRAMLLGSVDSDAAAREHADLVIAPDMKGFGLTSWQQLAHMREEGRRAARAALARAPASLVSRGE